ncbi:glutathione-dependent disulfide-bond oxidoreductase [Streptococcus didelphis]|uniref:glutathione-dependent disulfide-bond oxidoreductase n=1 Tax=Streptococcus didelphis TaxID=102886 RepID=UPI000370435A|nr:glutathione-dependent disulfide-bond oxidoreductase [Streptococcus didelphis]
MSDYKLPPVWKNTADANSLNQDTAGSRFQQKLPQGEAPFQLYTFATPNGLKPLIMFEELKELGIADASYNAYKIDISQGQQFGSDFVKINPNSKIPALLDLSKGKGIRVFESANILLYLAEKFQLFMDFELEKRTEVLNWLFWQTGAAPFLAGGFGHFFHYAPEKLEYPINRYTMEAKRQLDLLDKYLAKQDYMLGEKYTIADMAIWSWYGQLVEDKLYDNAAQFLDVNSYKHLKAWAEKISQRPAVKRASQIELGTID